MKKYILIAIIAISTIISGRAYAADYYAAANRFLYNGTNNYGSTPQWSAPVRYNEYVPIAFLYGLQINTYPTGAPTGQYVTVRGKINVSARNQGENLYPMFNPNALNNLQVQCSWGNQYLTTVGSSVMNSIGSGYYNPNSVIWDDITFTWNGYFPSGYQNIHSGDLLSCSVRPVINNQVYAVPMITGSNVPQTYVYGDNSSYDSYLSVETSQDQDLTALNEINNSIQNQTNIINNSTNRIIEAINNINIEREEEKIEYEEQQEEVDSSANDAGEEADQATSNLIDTTSSIIQVIRDTPATNCNIRIQTNNFDTGNINLCDKVPQAVRTTISAIIVIPVTLGALHIAYSLVMLYLNTVRKEQD